MISERSFGLFNHTDLDMKYSFGGKVTKGEMQLVLQNYIKNSPKGNSNCIRLNFVSKSTTDFLKALMLT